MTLCANIESVADHCLNFHSCSEGQIRSKVFVIVVLQDPLLLSNYNILKNCPLFWDFFYLGFFFLKEKKC